MVCLDQASWDMCESHHSVTVQRNGEWNEISFYLNKQAMFTCLCTFGRPGKAILLELAVNVVTYSPIQVPSSVMMGY